MCCSSASAPARWAAVIGIGEAYLGVGLVTWLQELVPAHLLGRVMSLVVLAVVALDPLSYALLPLGVTALFTVGGGTVLLAAALGLPLLARDGGADRQGRAPTRPA